MREIKFKFYCDESCTMSRIFTLEELANGRYDFHCDINKAIKLQYTGLKDKNGVEIYEGDILINKNQKDHKKNDWIGIIETNNFGGLSLKYKDYINPSWLGALSTPVNEPQNATWIMGNCEVIGNIYENPELLKGINQ